MDLGVVFVGWWMGCRQWYLGPAGPSSAFGCSSSWGGGCRSFISSHSFLPTCVMYYIGCLSLSGYSIVSLQWSPIVSFAAPPLTFATSAAQCRFWQRVGCCVLLRGVTFCSIGHV